MSCTRRDNVGLPELAFASVNVFVGTSRISRHKLTAYQLALPHARHRTLHDAARPLRRRVMEGIDASSADSSSPYPGRTLALVTSRTSICCRPGVHGATRGDGTADSHSILPGLSACHDGQEPHTDGLAKGARGGSTQSHSMQWAWVAHGNPSSPEPRRCFYVDRLG